MGLRIFWKVYHLGEKVMALMIGIDELVKMRNEGQKA